MKKTFAVLMIVILIIATFSGCSETRSDTGEAVAFSGPDTGEATASADYSKPARDGAKTGEAVSNGAAAADGEEVDVIPAKTIDRDGTYTLSGDISGQVLVTAESVMLILDGANITCQEASAILGKDGNGDDVIQKLTVELKGESTVTSGAKHGIQGKDDLTVTGSGTVNISAVKDGLHAGGTLTVADGNVNVLKSYEGMEASNIVISGGTSTVNATDDGINAAVDEDDTGTPSVLMSGGTLIVYSTADGIDSNGSMDITGGTAAIFIGATRDGEAIDVDRSGSILPALFGSAQISAGTKLSVGSLWSFTPAFDVVSFCLMIPGLIEGQSYPITVDGSTVATVTATDTIQSMMGTKAGGGMGNRTGGRQKRNMP